MPSALSAIAPSYNLMCAGVDRKPSADWGAGVSCREVAGICLVTCARCSFLSAAYCLCCSTRDPHSGIEGSCISIPLEVGSRPMVRKQYPHAQMIAVFRVLHPHCCIPNWPKYQNALQPVRRVHSSREPEAVRFSETAEQQSAGAITVNIRQPINIDISTFGWQEWLRRHLLVVVVVVLAAVKVMV